MKSGGYVVVSRDRRCGKAEAMRKFTQSRLEDKEMIKKGTLSNKEARIQTAEPVPQRNKGGEVLPQPKGVKSSKNDKSAPANEDDGKPRTLTGFNPSEPLDGVWMHDLNSTRPTIGLTLESSEALGVVCAGGSLELNIGGEKYAYLTEGQVFGFRKGRAVEAIGKGRTVIIEVPAQCSDPYDFITQPLSDSGNDPDAQIRIGNGNGKDFGFELIKHCNTLRSDMVYIPIGSMNIDIIDIISARTREEKPLNLPLALVVVSGTPIAASKLFGQTHRQLQPGSSLPLSIKNPHFPTSPPQVEAVDWKLTCAHSDARILIISK